MINKLKSRIYDFLRWSQKYTGTDNVYLAKGGFWLVLGHGAQIILGLILLVAFANLLPKEAYGTYQYIISIAGIVSIFTLTGMGTAIMRAAARGSDSSLRYGFRVRLKWSIGIVIASGIMAIYYYINGNTLLASGLLIVGAFQPFVSGFGMYKSYLVGKQLFRDITVLETVQKILPFAALLPALFLTNDPLIIIFIYFSSHAVSLFLVYKIVNSRNPAPLVPDPELTNYSKHLSVMSSISTASNYLDKVLIWYFLGAIPTAAYTLAQNPVSHINSLFQLVHSLTFSKIAKKDFRDLKITLPSKIRRYFVFVAISVGAYILATPFLFSLFFPAYPESIIYSQLLALTVLATPRSLLGQVFIAHKMKREQYIARISTPVVRIALLGILLPFFGIFGAIFAIIGTNAFEAAIYWHLFNRTKIKV
jgi:O-antigen/teichoic acid export membrane protein